MQNESNGLQAALKALRDSKRRLLADKEKIDADLQAVERAIELISGNRGPREVVVTTPEYGQQYKPYAGMKASSAVRKLLEDNPRRKFRATEAWEELDVGGFYTKSSTPATVVGNCLRRLSQGDDAIVERGTRDGVTVFWLKDESTSDGPSPTTGPGKNRDHRTGPEGSEGKGKSNQ